MTNTDIADMMYHIIGNSIKKLVHRSFNLFIDFYNFDNKKFHRDNSNSDYELLCNKFALSKKNNYRCSTVDLKTFFPSMVVGSYVFSKFNYRIMLDSNDINFCKVSINKLDKDSNCICVVDTFFVSNDYYAQEHSKEVVENYFN